MLNAASYAAEMGDEARRLARRDEWRAALDSVPMLQSQHTPRLEK